MVIDVLKVFIPSTLSFIIGIVISTIFSHYLYKYKMWKKVGGKKSLSGESTPVFDSIHREKEVGTPKMGGVIIWLSALVTTLLIWMAALFINLDWVEKLDFLSRNQTWIPLFALVFGAMVGLVDDILDIRGNGSHIAGGLSLGKRLLLVTFIAWLGALWFYFKLDVRGIGMPEYLGSELLYLGPFFILFFMAVVVFIYSGGVIDGIDGLAGGIFAINFGAYAVIAFYQNQINLAAFCAVLVGGILAFLWFNIPPARYYMSETGTMGLTIALAVVAFMTDALGEGRGIMALPFIAFPLVISSLSDIAQIFSKKVRGKKIFRIAPVHHHFEAIGWPSCKVTMRYWVISVVTAIIGIIIALI